MAKVVLYPAPCCLKCKTDIDPVYGVVTCGQLLGPYCKECADRYCRSGAMYDALLANLHGSSEDSPQ